MFQFSCRFAFFINFSSLKTDTENAPKLIIFDTHNLQTFKHNTLINKLLLMQFYLINIRPKLHHRIDENYASFCLVNMLTVPNVLDFTINAVLYPTFIRKLCYKMSSIVTFTFIQIFYQNCAFFTEWHQSCRVRLIQCQNSCYFRCPI